MKFLILLLISSKAFTSPVKNAHEERIVGGEVASAGQFPYQAGMFLFKSFESDGASQCGGSLINPIWILTAGHCTNGKVRANVFLGTTDLNDLDDNSQMFQVSGASEIITNPNFDHSSLKNDCGLVRLPSSAIINQFVQTIPISSSDSNFLNEWAVASGFGKTSLNRVKNHILRYVDLQVISLSDCQDQWDDDTIDDTQVCVNTDTDPPQQTCVGDSGGPLVLKSNSQLIGITSYGSGDSCTDGTPVIFTRVNTQIKFIQETTGISF